MKCFRPIFNLLAVTCMERSGDKWNLLDFLGPSLKRTKETFDTGQKDSNPRNIRINVNVSFEGARRGNWTFESIDFSIEKLEHFLVCGLLTIIHHPGTLVTCFCFAAVETFAPKSSKKNQPKLREAKSSVDVYYVKEKLHNFLFVCRRATS